MGVGAVHRNLMAVPNAETRATTVTYLGDIDVERLSAARHLGQVVVNKLGTQKHSAGGGRVNLTNPAKQEVTTSTSTTDSSMSYG